MRVFLIVLFLYTSCCVYLLDGKAMTADSKAILAIKQILLRSLDLAAPPPITNGLPSKAAIQHSIRIWENNTVEEAKYVEKATITLTAMNTRGKNKNIVNIILENHCYLQRECRDIESFCTNINTMDNNYY